MVCGCQVILLNEDVMMMMTEKKMWTCSNSGTGMRPADQGNGDITKVMVIQHYN